MKLSCRPWLAVLMAIVLLTPHDARSAVAGRFQQVARDIILGRWDNEAALARYLESTFAPGLPATAADELARDVLTRLSEAGTDKELIVADLLEARLEAPAVAVDPSRGEGGPSPRYTTVTVYYGTDRARTGRPQPTEFYHGDRGPVELGTCDVSIPYRHRLGRLESPFFLFSPDPARHVALLGVSPLDTAAWLANLQRRLATASPAEMLVFVHGYNVSFEDACRRTAQLAYDLKFPGAPVMWSWPSDGRLLGYVSDGQKAEWSVPHLRDFLTMLTAKLKTRAVHVVAHSMGNRVVTRALEGIGTAMKPADRPWLNQVVLTAPDIDRDVFLQLAGSLRKTSARTTLYASSSDKALRAAGSLLGGPRAGEAGADIVLADGIDTVDASAVDTSFVGHSYFGDKGSVIADLFDVLLWKRAPPQRFHLQERRPPGTIASWEFRRE